MTALNLNHLVFRSLLKLTLTLMPGQPISLVEHEILLQLFQSYLCQNKLLDITSSLKVVKEVRFETEGSDRTTLNSNQIPYSVKNFVSISQKGMSNISTRTERKTSIHF